MENKETIIIRANRQTWHGYDRIIIAAINGFGDLLGTVQVELFPETRWFGGTAYLYGLYVTQNHRRQGVAKALLKAAETLAANAGHKTLTLEWNIKESPIEICRWYSRLGYYEKEFTPGKCALMIKEL